MSSNSQDEKAVYDAACCGNIDIIRALFEKGINLNGYKDSKGWNAVMWAAYYGHLECLKFLVDNGGDFHFITDDGWNAVTWSAYRGHLECLKFLVESGGDSQQRDKWGKTAVDYAEQRVHTACYEFLRDFKQANETEKHSKSVNFSEKNELSGQTIQSIKALEEAKLKAEQVKARIEAERKAKIEVDRKAAEAARFETETKAAAGKIMTEAEELLSLREEVQQLKRNKIQLETSLHQRDQENSTLKINLSHLQFTVSALTSNQGRLEASVKQRDQENSTLKMNISNLQSAVSALTSNRIQLEASVKQRDMENFTLKMNIPNLQSAVSALTSNQVRLDASIKQRDEKLTVLTSEKNQLEEAVKNLEHIFSEKEKEITFFRIELENMNKEKEGEVCGLTEKLDELKILNSELIEKLRKVEQEALVATAAEYQLKYEDVYKSPTSGKVQDCSDFSSLGSDSKVTITKHQQEEGITCSGDSVVVDALFKSEHFDDLEVKVKISTSITSVSALKKDFEMLKFFNKICPDIFMTVYGCVPAHCLNLRPGCFPYSPDSWVLIMERGSVTLTKYLEKKINDHVKLHIVITLVNIIFSAHSNNYVLLDFKGDNVVKVNDDFKCIDLDSSYKIGSVVLTSDMKFTCFYTAPEIFWSLITQSVTVQPSMDIWSLGVLVFSVYLNDCNSSFWSLLLGQYGDRVGLDKSIEEFMMTAQSKIYESQGRIKQLIEKTFKSNPDVRHFLNIALSLNPADRSSVKFLMEKSLYRGGYSIAGSKLLRGFNDDKILTESQLKEMQRAENSVYCWLREVINDKSLDEVWGIVEKFTEQKFKSLDDVIAVKDILDVNFLDSGLGISLDICIRIVKSLNDLEKPPPPPLPQFSTSSFYSSSRYSISGFEIVEVENGPPVAGIKFGYFVDVNKSKVEVALKFADTGHKDTYRDISREADILVELQSLQSVVKILGTNPFEHLPHYIVLKHPGFSLSEFMISGNFEVRKFFIPKILEAMMSIHNAGYAHNDVKPSNIIIDRNSANPAIFCNFDNSFKFRSVIDFCGFSAGWSGLGAREFPRVSSDREDVFALGLVLGKLTNEHCNSLSVFPDDPRESSVLLTDQQELYKALGVTGAGNDIIEDMLKLIPEERPSIQEAFKRFQQLSATHIYEYAEKVRKYLIDNENTINSANIVKGVKLSTNDNLKISEKHSEDSLEQGVLGDLSEVESERQHRLHLAVEHYQLSINDEIEEKKHIASNNMKPAELSACASIQSKKAGDYLTSSAAQMSEVMFYEATTYAIKSSSTFRNAIEYWLIIEKSDCQRMKQLNEHLLEINETAAQIYARAAECCEKKNNDKVVMLQQGAEACEEKIKFYTDYFEALRQSEEINSNQETVHLWKEIAKKCQLVIKHYDTFLKLFESDEEEEKKETEKSKHSATVIEGQIIELREYLESFNGSQSEPEVIYSTESEGYPEGNKKRISIIKGKENNSYVRLEEEFDVIGDKVGEVEMVADQLLVRLEDDSLETQKNFIQDLNHSEVWLEQIFSDEPLFSLHFLPDGSSSITSETAEMICNMMTTFLDKIKLLKLDNPEIHAEPNFFFESLSIPQDPLYEKQWNLNDFFGITPPHNLFDENNPAVSSPEHPVIVAVIDSGVKYDHEDLEANMWNVDGEHGNKIRGFNALSGKMQYDPMDFKSHGTCVSGIIGAVCNNSKGLAGVAGMPGMVRLMPCLVSNHNTKASETNILRCIRFARDHGAKILNCSFGLSCPLKLVPKLQLLKHALSNEGKKNRVVVVCAAGNSGQDNDDPDKCREYPASFSLPNLIAVAATTRRGTLAETFTNYGKRSVHIAAPGILISSTTINPSNLYGHDHWGTSYAAPHVTAAVALLMAKFPHLQNNIPALIDRLQATADPLMRLIENGDQYCIEIDDNKVASGRLNLNNALKSDLSGDFGYINGFEEEYQASKTAIAMHRKAEVAAIITEFAKDHMLDDVTGKQLTWKQVLEKACDAEKAWREAQAFIKNNLDAQKNQEIEIIKRWWEEENRNAQLKHQRQNDLKKYIIINFALSCKFL